MQLHPCAEICTRLDSAAKWVNRALTVFMLMLKQSYLDELYFLNLAKYSLIATP